MKQNELLAKVKELKELMTVQEEIANQIEALKDEIKAEMTAQQIDKMEIGGCKISYTKYISHRFDSTAFKAKYEKLYAMYSKEVSATRFTLNETKKD